MSHDDVYEDSSSNPENLSLYKLVKDSSKVWKDYLSFEPVYHMRYGPSYYNRWYMNGEMLSPYEIDNVRTLLIALYCYITKTIPYLSSNNKWCAIDCQGYRGGFYATELECVVGIYESDKRKRNGRTK